MLLLLLRSTMRLWTTTTHVGGIHHVVLLRRWHVVIHVPP